MIVNNFNLVRIAFLPAEADAPLVVDPNAPLAAMADFERFQSGAGKSRQVPSRWALCNIRSFRNATACIA